MVATSSGGSESKKASAGLGRGAAFKLMQPLGWL